MPLHYNRQSYSLDAVLEQVPASDDLDDPALLRLLDQIDAPRVLHAAVGTLLASYGELLRAALAASLRAVRLALVQKQPISLGMGRALKALQSGLAILHALFSILHLHQEGFRAGPH